MPLGSALPGSLLPAGSVHQSALLGAVGRGGLLLLECPPLVDLSPQIQRGRLLSSDPRLTSLLGGRTPPAPTLSYTLTVCFSTRGSYHDLPRFFICLFTPNPTLRMISFITPQERGGGSRSLPPRQAPSHPMLSLNLARDTRERAEPGLPRGLLLQTPHTQGPRRAGHTIACSPDSHSASVS